jgi:hypothetical protein
LFLVVVPPSAVLSQDQRDFRGTVYTSQDSTPISGVDVSVPALGITAATDVSGVFVLRNIPRTRLALTFQRIGLALDTIWIEPDQDTLLVYLQSVAVVLPAIEAQARLEARERFEQIVQPSVITIDRNTISRLPSLAEADVVKVVQLLPGTIATNDYSVG